MYVSRRNRVLYILFVTLYTIREGPLEHVQKAYAIAVTGELLLLLPQHSLSSSLSQDCSRYRYLPPRYISIHLSATSKAEASTVALRCENAMQIADLGDRRRDSERNGGDGVGTIGQKHVA